MPQAAPRPPLGALTGIFFRASNLTFGGGTPAMAALERELVERRGWLSQDQYGLAWAMARVTPGTNALAFCAGTGWMLHGWLAAFLAVAASSIPPSIVTIWLLVAWRAAEANFWVAAAIGAVSASVVGMMASSAYVLLRPNFRAHSALRALCFAGAGLIGSHLFHWSPIAILGGAAVAGAVWRGEPGE